MNLLEMETLEKLFFSNQPKDPVKRKRQGRFNFYGSLDTVGTLLTPGLTIAWDWTPRQASLKTSAKSARPHRKTGLRLKAGKLYQQERLQIQLPLQSKAIPVLFSSRAQETSKESTSKLTTCPYIVSTDSTWRIITQTPCASSYHKGFDLGGFSVEAIEHQVFHLLPPQHLRASL